MLIVEDVNSMQGLVDRVKKRNKLIGFVLTMGALHEGHLSLIRACRRECGFVVVSIFVNPTQFGPREDFKRYPRAWKRDRELLRKEGVDSVFYPKAKTMYPRGFSTHVKVEGLSNMLCGASRPGHFQGVTTVVLKLFNVVKPDIAYFGQKDYQQSVIIKRMVKDLNLDIKIRVMPIVRESDGLAMSSRNSYLNPKQRQDALCLYNSLKRARYLIKNKKVKNPSIVKREMKKIIRKASGKIDYIEIIDPETLEHVGLIKGKVAVALAVKIGQTRLIDNVVVR